MPDNKENITGGGRLGRGFDITSVSGIGDIVFDDDLPEEEAEAPAEKTETESDEYEKWLEENLKEAKGYGQKVSYEGEISKEDGSWYDNSTYAAYDRQMADAQERIRALKERDAKNKARDDFIHDMMPNWKGYSGDLDHYFARLGSIVWYLLTAGAGAGLSWCFGSRGIDMIPMAGVFGVIGAVIRYNGKEGFSLSESMQRGSVEIGLCITGLLVGLWGLFGSMPYWLIIILTGGFGALGVVVRERIFFARPRTEAFFKAIPFIIAIPIAISLIVTYKMMQENGYL